LNSEISEDKIYAYLLDESDFITKVTDFRTYGIINQYITGRFLVINSLLIEKIRWLYPLVPTTHDLRLREKTNLRYSDFNQYLVREISEKISICRGKESILHIQQK